MSDRPPEDEDRPRDDREGRPRRRRRDEDEDEEDWDERPRRRRRPPPDDPGLKYVLPLNTSPLAIVAGYLGLVSVLCVPAPFALLLGVLALRQLNRDPEKDGKGRAIFAIVMGAIFSIPLVIGLISFAANGFK